MGELDIKRHVNFISMNEIGEFCRGIVEEDIADEFIEFNIKDIDCADGITVYYLYSDFGSFPIFGETFNVDREYAKELIERKIFYEQSKAKECLAIYNDE